MIVIEHQDGLLEYSFSDGGFSIVDSCLYFSIEGESDDEEVFPPSCLFAVSGYPVDPSSKKISFELKDNPEYEKPYSCFYTTFHSSNVDAKIEINFITENEIKVSFSVISDDVNYYNDKAKPNLTKGSVSLKRRDIGELCIPS